MKRENTKGSLNLIEDMDMGLWSGWMGVSMRGNGDKVNDIKER